MIYCIRSPIRLTFAVAVAATLVGGPASAQDTADDCSFGAGPISAAQVTACLGGLEDRIGSLEPGGARAGEVDRKIEDLLAKVATLEATVMSLQSEIGDLTELQLVTTEKVEESEIEFGFDTPALADGLIIAFIADRSGNGTSGWGRIQGFVDERVSDSRVNTDVLRAADSYSATNHPYERSATIIMPVRTGEYYKIVQSSEIPFDPSLHMRNIYFVAIGSPETP